MKNNNTDKLSVEAITARIKNRVELMLLEMLPPPSCALKRQQNDWKKSQVKKQLSEILKNESV
jgi:hypothetical protein